MDGLKFRGIKKRISYVVHWSWEDLGTSKDDMYRLNPKSLIFQSFDPKLIAEKIKEIKTAFPNIVFGPVVERIVHTELTPGEKKKLEKVLDG